MKKKKREAKIKKQSGNLKIDNFFLILLSWYPLKSSLVDFLLFDNKTVIFL
jgi:hypothetical protein